MSHTGLSHKTAEKLLAQYGTNELATVKQKSAARMILEQFNNPLVIILLIATGVSMLLGDMIEGLLILCIVCANAILGFVQENKAENALAALKTMTVTLIKVIRDGNVLEIDGKLLVPGDIILLEEGNKIPADAKLLETVHLEVNESALTGESMPVEKDAHSKDHAHIYMGTIVSKGRAVAEVIATGMSTKFGEIAKNLGSIKKETTPLEKKLSGIAKQIGILALVASTVIFGIGVYHNHSFIEMFLTGVSLAVAAVPEGLPAVVTITLALGMQRMARQRAILRKLSAIEAVGSITVIATDKTGTLTKNQMRVAKFWFPDHTYKHNDHVQPKDKKFLDRLLTISAYCNTASITKNDGKNSYDVIGDQTEGALLILADQHGVDAKQMKAVGKLVDEHAFDATTKTMSVIIKNEKDTYIYSKGAPEAILERSTHIISDTKPIKLTDDHRKRIISMYESFAKDGLRTIALAQRKITETPESRQHAEKDLTFVGIAGIADPPRDEVKDAIAIARKAGIESIMITGDNELTAHAIGKHIGLITHGEEVITGYQLAHLSDAELKAKLVNVRVFARTTPEQKLRIVRSLQSLGHVVAVTGDGVNDALALKQADVGVAMGRTGTDVAKEAADMIITDDNYATLVSAVAEGRGIYDNMKASIKYLLGCNMGEIVAIVGATIIGWPLILTPLQILYMNLATDSLQAIALAVNKKSKSIMDRKPINADVLFRKRDQFFLLEASVITAAVTLFAFYVGLNAGGIILGQSLAFTAIVICQQWIYLDIASFDQSIFSRRTFFNPWIILPAAVLLTQIWYLYMPLPMKIFKLSSPGTRELGLIITGTFLLIAVSEVRKKILHFHKLSS